MYVWREPKPIWETNQRRGLSEQNPADSMSNNLIFLKNTLSSSRFLVDTGASVSVFPNQPRSPSSPGVGVQLRTADSSPWIPMEPTVISPVLFLTVWLEFFDVSMPIPGLRFSPTFPPQLMYFVFPLYINYLCILRNQYIYSSFSASIKNRVATKLYC